MSSKQANVTGGSNTKITQNSGLSEFSLIISLSIFAFFSLAIIYIFFANGDGLIAEDKPSQEKELVEAISDIRNPKETTIETPYVLDAKADRPIILDSKDLKPAKKKEPPLPPLPESTKVDLGQFEAELSVLLCDAKSYHENDQINKSVILFEKIYARVKHTSLIENAHLKSAHDYYINSDIESSVNAYRKTFYHLLKTCNLNS